MARHAPRQGEPGDASGGVALRRQRVLRPADGRRVDPGLAGNTPSARGCSRGTPRSTSTPRCSASPSPHPSPSRRRRCSGRCIRCGGAGHERGSHSGRLDPRRLLELRDVVRPPRARSVVAEAYLLRARRLPAGAGGRGRRGCPRRRAHRRHAVPRHQVRRRGRRLDRDRPQLVAGQLPGPRSPTTWRTTWSPATSRGCASRAGVPLVVKGILRGDDAIRCPSTPVPTRSTCPTTADVSSTAR